VIVSYFGCAEREAMPGTRPEQPRIKRERDSVHDGNRRNAVGAVVDQHIPIRNVRYGQNDRGYEKQGLRTGIQPFIAKGLRIRLADHPVGRQVIDLDCSPGNAVGQLVSDEN
jgi:hypothetical protein